MELGVIDREGLVIAFDTEIVGGDLNVDSIQVLVAQPNENLGLLCWCELNLEDSIQPGDLEKSCVIDSPFTHKEAANAMVNAVRLRLRALEGLLKSARGQLKLRVKINGDFVRGFHLKKTKELRALDADHVPKLDPPSPPHAPQPGIAPEWMQRGDGRHSGDGIEGGTFDSWFTVKWDG
jgi:hypothetical protein